MARRLVRYLIAFYPWGVPKEPRERHEPKPTQRTQPKGRDKDGKPYEPIEIPVPTEGDVMGLLEKVAHAPADADEK